MLLNAKLVKLYLAIPYCWAQFSHLGRLIAAAKEGNLADPALTRDKSIKKLLQELDRLHIKQSSLASLQKKLNASDFLSVVTFAGQIAQLTQCDVGWKLMESWLNSQHPRDWRHQVYWTYVRYFDHRWGKYFDHRRRNVRDSLYFALAGHLPDMRRQPIDYLDQDGLILKSSQKGKGIEAPDTHLLPNEIPFGR